MISLTLPLVAVLKNAMVSRREFKVALIALIASYNVQVDAQLVNFVGVSPSPKCNDEIDMNMVLMEDLYCDCTYEPAVTIKGHGNTFRLNGFSVSCMNNTDLDQELFMNVGIKVEGHKNCVIGPGNVTESNHGIVLDGEGSHLVERVSITDTGNDGIYVVSEANVIDTSTFEMIGDDGIQVGDVNGTYAADNNVIRNCEIRGTGEDGINTYTNFNLIEGNYVEDTDDDCIDVDDGLNNRIISNNLVDCGEDGIDAGGPGGHYVIENKVLGVNSTGIGSSTSEVPAKIARNHVVNSGGLAGIGVSSLDGGLFSSYDEIDNNIVVSNDAAGIVLAFTTHAKITNNVIHDNGCIGIFSIILNFDTVVSDNIITSHEGVNCGGLLVDLSSALASGNVFANNEQYDAKAVIASLEYLENNLPPTNTLTPGDILKEELKDFENLDSNDVIEKLNALDVPEEYRKYIEETLVLMDSKDGEDEYD